MDLSMLLHFPSGFEPNDPQTFILSQIAEGLKNGKRNFIVNAPTGTGKSFIAKTIANYSQGAPSDFLTNFKASYFTPKQMEPYRAWGTAIVTCTKALQEQYCSLFPDGDVMMGKDNYECTKSPSDLCSDGPCVINKNTRKKCFCDKCCPYQQARINTHTNKCAFYNYSLFFSLPDEPLKKDWIIFDEASEMEDELVKAYTVVLYYKTLRYNLGYVPPTPTVGSDPEKYFAWLKQLENEAKLKATELYDEMKNIPRKKSAKYERIKSTFNRVRDLYASIVKVITVWDFTEWFPIHTGDCISFVPYHVDKLFWRQGKVAGSNCRVFLSATIVNYHSFMRTLGLSYSDTMYIESPSSLDPALAPIVPVMGLYPTYKTKGDVYPQLAKAAIKIANNSAFADKKGLIHTQSMELLNHCRIVADENERFLFRGNGLSNQDILNIHSSTDRPTVLVSPSMTHGVDLKGELGEFQVVMKAPYPSKSDPRVARKLKDDPDWYRDRMLSTLIQECGRCNRLKTDRAVTFILDSYANIAIDKNSELLPKYFLSRIAKKRQISDFLLEQ